MYVKMKNLSLSCALFRASNWYRIEDSNLIQRSHSASCNHYTLSGIIRYMIFTTLVGSRYSLPVSMCRRSKMSSSMDSTSLRFWYDHRPRSKGCPLTSSSPELIPGALMYTSDPTSIMICILILVHLKGIEPFDIGLEDLDRPSGRWMNWCS